MMGGERGIKYQQVHDQDQDHDHEHDHNDDLELRSTDKKYRRLLILITSGGSLIIFIILTFVYLRHATQKNIVSQCGTSSEEARAKGCTFELTGSSWVPPECYDAETEAEFLEFQEWHFYRDINYTDLVPLEEVRRGEGPGFFVNQEYHSTHCMFLFKKLHRAYEKGRKTDGLVSPLHHTSHCIEWLLHHPEDHWNKPQYAYTKFPYCGKDGGFNVDDLRPGWVDD